MIQVYAYNDTEDGTFTAHYEDSQGYMTHFIGHKSFKTLNRSIKENMEFRKVSMYAVMKTWETTLIMWDCFGQKRIIKKE